MTMQADKQGSSLADSPSLPEGSTQAARSEERFFASFKRNAFAQRSWFLVTLAGIVLLHAALLAALLYRDDSAPLGPPPPEETPVEVVAEPPKPPEPSKQAEQKETPPSAPEKPASSAPREANDEKVDTARTDKDTHAPKTPTPPTEGQPDVAAEASAPSDAPTPPDKPDEAQAAAAAPDKDAEALDKAVPLPPKRPDLPKPTPPAKTRVAKTSVQRLAGASELHDFTFARPTKKSPVAGGTEDSRFLAIVFGMIMSKRRMLDTPNPDSDVTLAFDLDDGGNLMRIGIVRTSGDPQVDAAALAAIRRAAPFPPPPPGSPHGLIATIGFSDSPQAAGRIQ